MILPDFFFKKCRRRAFVILNAPFKLTAITSSKSASRICKSSLSRVCPQLFTNISIFPASSSSFATQSPRQQNRTRPEEQNMLFCPLHQLSPSFHGLPGNRRGNNGYVPCLPVPELWRWLCPIPLEAPVTRAVLYQPFCSASFVAARVALSATL